MALYLFYAVIISQYEFNHNIELIIATGSFVCLGGFIDDTVDGIIKCLKFNQKKSFHEIFNLGTGRTVSILNLTNIIGKTLKANYKVILKTHHPTDMKVTKSNMTKSKKLLSFNPKVDLKKGIKKYIDWHLNY